MVMMREEIDSYADQLKRNLASYCTWSPQLQATYEDSFEEGADDKIMNFIMET